MKIHFSLINTMAFKENITVPHNKSGSFSDNNTFLTTNDNNNNKKTNRSKSHDLNLIGSGIFMGVVHSYILINTFRRSFY